MAKIQASDLMLLNRENQDGTRSIYSYNGLDFDESVQQVIDDNELFNIYVNMSGDDMSGLLTIDVNKSLVNPENLLCLDVIGRTNSKQLYLNPSNNDAAHISVYFEGERDHLVYYENTINLVNRQYIGDTDEVDDKTMLTMERDNTHLHSGLTLGISAVQPTIRFQSTGEATFDGKVLLVDTLDLEENHAAHKGYVDVVTTEVRDELTEKLTIPVINDNYFTNVNVTSTVTLEQSRFICDQAIVDLGEIRFVYTEPDELGTPQTNWQSVESIEISYTTSVNGTVNTSLYEVGNEISISNVHRNSNLHYTCATYVIDSVELLESWVKINVTLEFISNQTLNEAEDEVISGTPLDAVDGESYMLVLTETSELSELDEGTFYWETIPNSVDSNGNEVNDWRVVNKLVFSTKDSDGNDVTPSTFREGSSLEANAVDFDEELVTAATYEIVSSTAIQVEQVDQASFENVLVDAIEVIVQYQNIGDDLQFRPGTRHNLRVLSTEEVRDYIEDENARIDSRIDTNDAQIQALQNDVLVLEQAFERGRLYYSSASGGVSTGRFALNDDNGNPINQLSNTSITHIYLHKTDFQGGYKEWTSSTEEGDFDPLDKAILFVEVRDELGVDGHGEFLIDDYEDAGDFVHFTVTFSSGSNAINTSDSLYTVKVVSTNQGISSVDAYSSFVNKAGDSNMRGNFIISNNDSVPVLKLKNDGALDLGSVSAGTDGTISFYGNKGVINKGVTTVLEFDTDELLTNISFDMNGNSIKGLPTPNGSIGTEAANVEYVSNYVEATTATTTSTGGIKIQEPFGMSGDYLTIGVANVKTADNVTADDMGVCAFNNETFTQNTTNGAKFITARTTASYSNYGMVKITTPLVLDNGGRLTINRHETLIHTGTDNKYLGVREGTTSVTGVVRLSDSVSSSSTSRAATANAVKTAYDKAVTAQNGNFSAGDRVVASSYSGASFYGLYEDGGNLYWRK